MHNYRQKKDRSEEKEVHYNAKFQRRFTDQQRREHEDQLGYFKVVYLLKSNKKFSFKTGLSGTRSHAHEHVKISVDE